MNTTTQLITREMILGDVVQQYPDAARVMLEYGLHCVGCFANQFDTVEQGAAIHGMEPEELEEMLERVNKIAQEQELHTH